MLRSAIVVGTGLVGTSIALALTARGVTVYLRDASSSAVRVAAGLGAGRLEDPSAPVDVALVAVPPAGVGTLVAELQRSGAARAYTDVASVKGPAQLAVETFADATTFIGGHPLAGGERSGPVGARKDLCDGRPWVLTPSRSTSQAVLNTVLELVSPCGAIPVVMDAHHHDEAVALVSHAPHAALPLKHGAAAAELGEVSVSIADEPGELAEILSAVGGIDVNVEDIAIEHSSSAEGGTVKLLIAHAEVVRTARSLLGKGWKIRN